MSTERTQIANAIDAANSACDLLGRLAGISPPFDELLIRVRSRRDALAQLECLVVADQADGSVLLHQAQSLLAEIEQLTTEAVRTCRSAIAHAATQRARACEGRRRSSLGAGTLG